MWMYVCMYVCVCVYVYVCVFFFCIVHGFVHCVCMCVCIYTSTFMLNCMHMWVVLLVVWYLNRVCTCIQASALANVIRTYTRS